MRSRLLFLSFLTAGLMLLLAACATATSDDDAVEAADAVAEATDDGEEATDDAVEEEADDAVDDSDAEETPGGQFVPLDIETLQAETPRGTLQATELPNTFVAAVTGDLFVGISIPPEGSQYAEGSEIIVYICDSDEIAGFLYGDLSSGEAVSDDGDMRVMFEIGNDEITGSVEVNGSDQGSFVAAPSDDESGVFYALIDAYVDDMAWQLVRIGPPPYTGGWIILNAQHQQGFWWDRDPEDSGARW